MAISVAVATRAHTSHRASPTRRRATAWRTGRHTWTDRRRDVTTAAPSEREALRASRQERLARRGASSPSPMMARRWRHDVAAWLAHTAAAKSAGEPPPPEEFASMLPEEASAAAATTSTVAAAAAETLTPNGAADAMAAIMPRSSHAGACTSVNALTRAYRKHLAALTSADPLARRAEAPPLSTTGRRCLWRRRGRPTAPTAPPR